MGCYIPAPPYLKHSLPHRKNAFLLHLLFFVVPLYNNVVVYENQHMIPLNIHKKPTSLHCKSAPANLLLFQLIFFLHVHIINQFRESHIITSKYARIASQRNTVFATTLIVTTPRPVREAQLPPTISPILKTSPLVHTP